MVNVRNIIAYVIAMIFLLAIFWAFFLPVFKAYFECKKFGGDYCLSDGERECKEACAPNSYFYEFASGLFSSDVECVCGIGLRENRGD